MSQPNQKAKFWAILMLINIAVIVYPINLYTNADSNEQEISALVVLVGTGFVMAIIDAVCALMAYS